MAFQFMCPQCQCRGDVVQKTPHTIRRCKNGHRWADGRGKKPSGYIPVGVQLAEAREDLQGALSALQQAETMIKDCASLLTPAQRSKLAVHTELHNIEQAKAKLSGAIELTGERLGVG